jgi:hypothetical protein
MNTLRSWLKGGSFLVLSFALLPGGARVFGQTVDSNLVPVVTVQATQPIATATNSGVFTVFRAGNTNATLNVWYDLGGTASNCVDYAPIPPHLVEIAAGVTSSTITIAPIEIAASNVVKTVVLTLTNSPLLNPVNYEIGSPSQAVVYIEENGATNLPPEVSIIQPPDGAVFYTPTNILILAKANDPDGFVTNVEFFAGGGAIDIGSGTPVVLDPPGVNGVTGLVYLFNWRNPPSAGTFPLTAVATDNGGLSTTSAPVNIIILPPLPPPTNRPPIVSIVATDPVAIEGTNCWVWPGETNSPPTWAAWPTAICQYFTNCGPKTATFTVRRFGDTNGDLTVPYDIGGTASNGVDYVALPGFVTIPAGERHAFITIVPIDDGPPDMNKTVILALAPDTNAPPDYLLGFPRRAAAIIIDQGPCPATGMLPGGCFHFVTPGPDAAWFAIESSTDLVNWTPVCTNQVIYGSIDFVDPDAQSNSSGFYRAVPLNSPPSE